MSDTAIADHALLSDRHSSALVDRSGSVEWLSFPRFLCERRRSRRVPRAMREQLQISEARRRVRL
jgi:GH15 family glucan-1,4-alpha-glucosidase